jgi:hypothetical protein
MRCCEVLSFKQNGVLPLKFKRLMTEKTQDEDYKIYPPNYSREKNKEESVN